MLRPTCPHLACFSLLYLVVHLRLPKVKPFPRRRTHVWCQSAGHPKACKLQASCICSLALESPERRVGRSTIRSRDTPEAFLKDS